MINVFDGGHQQRGGSVWGFVDDGMTALSAFEDVTKLPDWGR